VRRTRGSISIEVAILLPAFMMLVGLATVYGRLTIIQSQVDLAAHDASRAASLSTDDASATKAATGATGASLADAGCTTWHAALDEPSGFAVPAGQPAAVTVTVTCEIDLSDLGLAGNYDVTAVFTSPLDTYRSRS